MRLTLPPRWTGKWFIWLLKIFHRRERQVLFSASSSILLLFSELCGWRSTLAGVHPGWGQLSGDGRASRERSFLEQPCQTSPGLFASRPDHETDENVNLPFLREGSLLQLNLNQTRTAAIFLKNQSINFILFLAALGLHCCKRAFSSCSARASHGSGFSCCRAHAPVAWAIDVAAPRL